MTHFTPPFCGAVRTIVIAYVIKLIAKRFTKKKCPTLAKAFNKDNVTCTSNRVGKSIKTYISAYNKAIWVRRVTRRRRTTADAGAEVARLTAPYKVNATKQKTPFTAPK